MMVCVCVQRQGSIKVNQRCDLMNGGALEYFRLDELPRDAADFRGRADCGPTERQLMKPLFHSMTHGLSEDDIVLVNFGLHYSVREPGTLPDCEEKDTITYADLNQSLTGLMRIWSSTSSAPRMV